VAAQCRDSALARAASLDRDQRGGGLGGGAGHFRQDRLVGVGGDGAGGMAEHVLHDLDVDAGSKRERRGSVPQVVQPDRRQADEVAMLGRRVSWKRPPCGGA
jgi:hypothetical protein